jgi:hypothetical protein
LPGNILLFPASAYPPSVLEQRRRRTPQTADKRVR